MRRGVAVLRPPPVAHAKGSGFYEVLRSLAIPELDDEVQIPLYLLLLRYNQALFFSHTAQPAPDMRSAFARYSVAQDSGTPRLACASKSLKQSGSRCKVLLRTMMQQQANRSCFQGVDKTQPAWLKPACSEQRSRHSQPKSIEQNTNIASPPPS